MSWNWDLMFFGIFPYIAMALAIGVSIYRYQKDRFSYSSLSSQLLERKLLFWGSIPFHWGIIIILTGHFLAFLIPSSILAWNAHPLRLYALEATGLALGIWAFIGLCVLIYRRINTPRIQAVSTIMDLVVLGVIFVSIATGIWTAIGYRWGSNWFASAIAPYLWSLFYFQPKLELIAGLPIIVKIHAANAFLFLAIFPFTRLVHMLAVPFEYLVRPWQVISYRGRKATLLPVPSIHAKKKEVAQTSPTTIHRPQASAVPSVRSPKGHV